jgi:hypothetical protein
MSWWWTAATGRAPSGVPGEGVVDLVGRLHVDGAGTPVFERFTLVWPPGDADPEGV